jgi:hypothetical protein
MIGYIANKQGPLHLPLICQGNHGYHIDEISPLTEQRVKSTEAMWLWLKNGVAS